VHLTFDVEIWCDGWADLSVAGAIGQVVASARRGVILYEPL
jgi:hypothetical protein